MSAEIQPFVDAPTLRELEGPEFLFWTTSNRLYFYIEINRFRCKEKIIYPVEYNYGRDRSTFCAPLPNIYI